MRTDLKLIKLYTENSGTLNIYKMYKEIHIDTYLDTLILTRNEAAELINILRETADV